MLILNFGVIAAVVVRFDGAVPEQLLGAFYREAAVVFPLALLIFYACGLYHRVWHFASVDALIAVAVAVTASAVMLAVSMRAFAFYGAGISSLSLLTLCWMMWLLLIGGSRFSWRVVRQLCVTGRTGHDSGARLAEKAPAPAKPKTRVIIYGAGEAGAALADQIMYQKGNGTELVGFVDDNPKKRNMVVRHGRVLGSGKELKQVCGRHKCDQILVAIPSLSGPHLRRVVGYCNAAGVPYKVLPPALHLWENQVTFGQLRDLDVADLLGRDPAEFPFETCGEYLRGKRVLVTGAGGSIGSEICRQVARFHPQQLVLMGRGENRIHAIHLEIERHYPGMSVPFIGNVAVPAAVNDVFRRYTPEVVFHAAAHKHVPLMEPQPLEAIRNNVLGTQTLSEAASRHGVALFVMISTDKAVSATSVMGASKRLCELVVQRQQWQAGLRTRFVTVRFGNVLGSAGSVVHIFRDQIQRGEPLTITHPTATRYFMTIPEAALLVISAGGIGQPSGLYVLDMDKPVRILDLAEDMLRMAGRDIEDPANYRFVGLRPGEKLHEKLHSDEEVLERINPHILQVRPNGWMQQVDAVDHLLTRLRELIDLGDCESARTELLNMANNQYPVEKSMPQFAVPAK